MRAATPTRLYLASRSPRRRELLDQAGIAYDVLDVEVDESTQPAEAPARYVERVASDKAVTAFRGLASDAAAVLAADTTVVLHERILGKPLDAQDALRMLADLSGQTHQVLTAIALSTAAGTHTALSTSRVRFRPTTASERAAYVATGEPMDKAGAYAIQGRAAVFIAHLEGSYSGVMGLPLFETATLLAQGGLQVLGDVAG